jgi:L-rhamnose mutarotase
VPFFALTLGLRDDPEAIERYKHHHRAVWPEVEGMLRGIGILRMRIFLHERRLFMYLEAEEGFDPDRDLPPLMEDPGYARWEALMRTMQEQLPGSAPGEWWRPMELVYELGDA